MCVANLVCNWIECNYFLDLECEENDSIIQINFITTQINLSLFSNYGEYYALTDPSDHNIWTNNYHSINSFPTRVSDDICFTLIDLIEPINFYDLSFHYLNGFQTIDALST